MGKRARRISRENRKRKQANESLAAFAAGANETALGMKAMSDTALKVKEKIRVLNTAFDRTTLEGKTVAQLREIANAKGLKTTSKSRKGDMIEMLVGR